MKLEIKKEFSLAMADFVYRLYINGSLNQSFFSESEARKHAQKIEDAYIPEPEVIYVKELS